MENTPTHRIENADRTVILVIGLVLATYLTAIFFCGPELLDGHNEHATVPPAKKGHAAEAVIRSSGSPHTTDALGLQDSDDKPEDLLAAKESDPALPHIGAVLPFVLLLGAIALFPLISFTEHWWERNKNRLCVAVGLGLATLAYYFFLFPQGGVSKVLSILDHALLGEYVPFIVLLFSLYTISGGIRIQGDLAAKPSTNVGFLIVGGLLASFVGTTGAAMLLIRPLIDTNHERKYVQHTIVFFIFVVCNCGGCLLPIGDPPLFLGYLKGVSFLWTMEFLWWPWLLANSMIIAIYFLWDSLLCYPKESRTDVARDIRTVRPLQIMGLWPNILLLLGVIFSIAFLDPTTPLPGTEWKPWPYLREAVQLGMVLLSLWLGQAKPRAANKFNYDAMIEVAALFIGIFVCMQPAIEILHQKGGQLGLDTPSELYWATGGLSALLDNAPTYVVFFETAAADPQFEGQLFYELVSDTGSLAERARQLLVGISLGAVFMGR